MKVFPNSCSIYYFIFTIICEVFSFLRFLLIVLAISQIRGWGLFTSNNSFFMVLAPWIWNNNINNIYFVLHWNNQTILCSHFDNENNYDCVDSNYKCYNTLFLEQSTSNRD